MKNLFIVYAMLFCTAVVHAQVGIGTTNPKPGAILDIESDDSGIYIPKVALTSLNSQSPIDTGPDNPETGLMVFNTATAGVAPNNVTPGLYFWDDSGTWIRINSGPTVSSGSWELTGTSGTNPGTGAGQHYIGTADDANLIVGTNGSQRFNFTTNGRLRSSNTGNVGQPTYSWNGDANTGMYSPSADNLGFSTGGTLRLTITNTNQIHAGSRGTAALPFYSFSDDPNIGMWSPAEDNLAFSTGGTERMGILNDGVVVNTTAPLYAGDRFTVQGEDGEFAVNGYTSNGGAIYGLNTSGAGWGVLGESSNIGVEGYGAFGVFGESPLAAGLGMRALNTNASGTGLLAAGNNSPLYNIGAGAGAVLNGVPFGVVAFGNVAADGYGIVAAGNDLNFSTFAGGGGGSFTGRQWGVYANATLTGNSATNRAAFVGNYVEVTGPPGPVTSTTRTVYLGARIGGTNYKVLGTGSASVSTTMQTRDGERILFAPEAPENWFFDLGEVQLID